MTQDENKISDFIDAGIHAMESKCDTCKFMKSYHNGGEEYPPHSTFLYCHKGHWAEDNEPEPSQDKSENWENCKDYIKND